jgi:replicative DNA helicase
MPEETNRNYEHRGQGNRSKWLRGSDEVALLPQNLELEQLVLGALLTGDRQETASDVLVQTLDQADFATEKHKRICERMRDLQQRGKPIDRITVAEELQKQGQLESVGGISYLLTLEDGMPTLVGIEQRIAMLRELSRLRMIAGHLDEIRERVYCRDESGELLDRMHRIGEQMADGITSDEPDTVAKMLESMSVGDLLSQRHALGIEPFLPWLAQHVRFTPKSLTIVAARPSVGKSAFAQQQAWEAITRNYRTDFYSLEVSKEDNVRRIVAQQAPVNMRRLRLGHADDQERVAAQKKLGELALNENLRIHDAGYLTVGKISQNLWKAKARGKPVQFLIVDFVQLMSAVGKYSNEVQAMTSISRGLKIIAQDFDIPVLILSQMSREVEKQNREPRLSDLRESGSFEQDASAVIFLHRLGDNNPNDLKQKVLLMLAKNKDGEIGECELIFTKRYARFDEAGA